jgi:DNA-binding PadR family transcriptional regulator
MKMAFRSDIDALVLGVLKSGQLHGYEIVRRINHNNTTILQVKDGQIYPLLHRLENEEYIVSAWIAQEGKPSRKEYKLTPKGEKALEDKAAEWQKFTSAVNTILFQQTQEITR